MTDRNCENWSTNKQPLTDRARAICKRLTDRAHQTDKFLDYDLLMTAVEVIEEMQKYLRISADTMEVMLVEKKFYKLRMGGLTPDEEAAIHNLDSFKRLTGDGLTPDESKGDAP